MDILYVIGKGKSSAGDCFELRQSLRSIAKYGHGIDRVLVVGYCPEWLSDEVVKLPYYDGMPICRGRSMGDKTINIMANVVYAIEAGGITECLASMDDHFYLRDVDFDNYPYYVRDTEYKWRYFLPQSQWLSTYLGMLSNTRNYLESVGLPYLNFAIHRNMHVRADIVRECKSKVEDIIARRCSSIECFAWWNNILLSRGEIEPTIVMDFKPKSFGEFEAGFSGQEVFSTPDFIEGSTLYKLLDKLYPEKCIYEK